ncbi:MAG: T9SS type A sorting domain-containing protein, partial [Taibaiella sp.]|nr:T9SS type A sorting domain-containing protein [Taibaiella sp.]
VGTNSAVFATSSLPNGAVVRCILFTPDTCVTKNTDTSNSITMKIKPVLTPDVTVSVSPNDTICNGDMATFTATPVNGGTSPVYQWRVNGVNAGTNSATFATTLSDGDVVDCIMTSSEQCLTKPADTSAGITITVLPKVTPDVQMIVLPDDTICDGTNVTFIATPANGGTTPIYQWQINGANVGTNNTSYSSPFMIDGDVVRVIMTSSELCLTKPDDTSNTITMKVNPNLTPDVTITVSPNDTICVGTSVTFTATPVNGGTAPVYQWRVNGSNVGTNSNTYSTSTLADNDVVDCILTSSEICVTRATDTSNAIIMEVKPYITPDVTIAVSPNDTVCDGTSVTFTATPTNGGDLPGYQWQINGANVGTNSSTYASTALVNNDAVRVILTSSEMCLTKTMDTSNVINMTVEPNLTPDITIVVSPDDTVCAGTNVVFLANATNGGTSPTYQWKVNGNNVGINSSGYTSNSLVTGDVVTCVLTSNHTCLTRTMDTSNAVTMTVNALTTPAVTISVNTGTTSCVNGEVTFTAVPVNGGTAQAYQWRLNGTDIMGANSTTYMTSSLSTGDVITCRLDITAVCPAPDSAISNSLVMNIVTPSAVIAVSPNDTICDNQSAMFTVNGTNVGNTPVYQWMLNGVDQVGVTGTLFTMNTVGHQDIISIEFVSSDNCINAPAVAGANTITMTVNPTAAPVVGIAANPGTVLTNSDIVWFTSSANTPNVNYQWRKNGVNIPGATGPVYTDLDPQDGDTFSLWIQTNDSCRTPDTAISNIVVLSVGVGVKEVATGALFNNVNLAPNPNNGTFTLKGTLATNDKHVMLEVVNAVGAVIHREQVEVQNHELNARIDLGDKAHNGLHMVRITAGGRAHIVKFIANR